eukprot:1037669-Pelagomonas_calceolata.AAC.1
MEAALRAAAEGAWHLAGNQRRLVARQHTYKRPVGFGSSMDSSIKSKYKASMHDEAPAGLSRAQRSHF